MFFPAGATSDFFDLFPVHSDDDMCQGHFTFGTNRNNFGSSFVDDDGIGRHEFSYIPAFKTSPLGFRALLKRRFRGELDIVSDIKPK